MTVLLRIASFYSYGFDEVIEQLAEQWKAEILLEFANSTEWKSRILWPPELAGQEYFDFRGVQPKTPVEKLREVMFGPVYEYFPCEVVRHFLASR